MLQCVKLLLRCPIAAVGFAAMAAYTAVMPKPPDLETLSRRFLDLWQDQMTAMAADPEMAEVMTRLMGMTAPGMAAFMPLAIGGLGGLAGGAKEGEERTREGHRDAETETSSSAGEAKAPPRAAAAATASGGGGLDLDELARRLADVERRLDELEARAGAGGGRARGKPRRQRS
jgi:hypothetical protein